MDVKLKFLLLLPTMLSLFVDMKVFVCGEPQVPCLFIFGDSLFDNGNNNDLFTVAKANYPPYGVDFPEGPTGRFTNGRNIMDFIAEHLGFEKYIQPFAALAKDGNVLVGANYASGAAGIRDETGAQLGEVISLNKQLRNHKSIVARIAWLLGSKRAARNHLKQCIYTVGMGNNDYINNYLVPEFYISSRLYTPQKYADVLIRQYTRQLQTLYGYGARKVALFGLGILGCTPAEMESNNSDECVDSVNNDVKFLNDRLKTLVDDFNTQLTDAKFIFIDVTYISAVNVNVTTITDTTDSCCVFTNALGKGQCVQNGVPCSDRKAMAFWDGFHPTETSNSILAGRAYNALTPSDTYPFDIRRLAQTELRRAITSYDNI